MTKILILNPIHSDQFSDEERAYAQEFVRSGTTVTLRNLPELPVSAYIPSEEIVIGPLLQAIVQGERDGFDAIGVSCASDPGVRIGKDLVSIPVTGPFESMVRTATSIGRFSVLYPGVPSGELENLPQNGNWIRRLSRGYGVLDQLASTHALPCPRVDDGDLADLDPVEHASKLSVRVKAEMQRASKEHTARLVEQAMREHEAEVAMLACTFWAASIDSASMPIPVLDPLISLARHTETLALAR